MAYSKAAKDTALIVRPLVEQPTNVVVCRNGPTIPTTNNGRPGIVIKKLHLPAQEDKSVNF
jgi:hypothetical protein